MRMQIAKRYLTSRLSATFFLTFPIFRRHLIIYPLDVVNFEAIFRHV